VVRGCLILLIFPMMLQASCLDNNDPVYNLAVSQGNYAKAFDVIAQEVHLTPEEKRHFKIIEGYSHSHDDRNGQADPETLEARLDPDLFIEGKEGACQDIMHELTHLRQFRRDRSRLHAAFSNHPVPEEGWKGCDRDALAKPDAQGAEDQAYDCLEDNDLVAHTAAGEIESVMAQIPYAAQRILRDDDVSYLADNLAQWASHESMITDRSNQAYYLADIKQNDIRIFCQGFKEARARFAKTEPALGAWQLFCRNRH
jgi:hypothetical protein